MTQLATLIEERADGRALGAEDALALRRVIFSDARVSPDEADALVRLNEVAQGASREWLTLFTEALTDFVVYQQEPRGYIDEAKADWLIAALSHDGKIARASELETLIHVLEAADQAPARLAAFVLTQVKTDVLTGDGAAGSAISASEVAELRRVLYAMAGGSSLAVSREEASVLFDLNDATRGLANDPAWTDLFAKAIGSAIMQPQGYHGLDRAEAQRLEGWLESPTPGVGDILLGVAKAFGRAPVGRASHQPTLEDQWTARNVAEDAAIADAAPVNAEEAGWIVDRVGRDGQFDANERAMLAFLRQESPSLHAALTPLLKAA